MPARIRHACLVAFSLITIASACAGGPSTEEYFRNLEEFSRAHNSELDDLEGEFNAGLLDIDFDSPAAEQQLIELFQASISGTAASFAVLIREISKLDPPSEVTAPHTEAVEAARWVLAEYDQRAEQLQAIATIADIDEYTEAFSGSGVRARFSESCRQLQAIADRESIDADLGC